MKEFEDAVNGTKGELDSWLELNNEEECRVAIKRIMQQRNELVKHNAILLKAAKKMLEAWDFHLNEISAADNLEAAITNTSNKETT